MFWKKKKPKRKQPVKKQIPKHIADNLKYGESVAFRRSKRISAGVQTANLSASLLGYMERLHYYVRLRFIESGG